MRAQSLYSYFDSKHAIYDAMFQEGNEELLRRMQAVRDTDARARRAFPVGRAPLHRVRARGSAP